jgi:hypothetical protein
MMKRSTRIIYKAPEFLCNHFLVKIPERLSITHGSDSIKNHYKLATIIKNVISDDNQKNPVFNIGEDAIRGVNVYQLRGKQYISTIRSTFFRCCPCLLSYLRTDVG